MNGGYNMKKYIKPEAELIEYSLSDVIAVSGEMIDEEDKLADVIIPGGDGGDGDIFGGDDNF